MPDEGAIDHVREQYHMTSPQSEDGDTETFPSTDLERRIDYAFVTPDVRI